jgi:hypothetical protein
VLLEQVVPDLRGLEHDFERSALAGSTVVLVSTSPIVITTLRVSSIEIDA